MIATSSSVRRSLGAVVALVLVAIPFRFGAGYEEPPEELPAPTRVLADEIYGPLFDDRPTTEEDWRLARQRAIEQARTGCLHSRVWVGETAVGSLRSE